MMQRLFLPPDQISGDTVHILGLEHHHLIRVMRARAGEAIMVLDGNGNAYRAVLVSIERDGTRARIEETLSLETEPGVRITVAQALGKGDKFEQVIQHGTEAGASAFVPVRAERCVVDVPVSKVADRMARWRQIAKSAAEQSGRLRIPEIREPERLAALAPGLSADAVALFLHAESAISLSSVLGECPGPPAGVVLFVGPEGGWSPAEVSVARSANLRPVTLGPRILRTETAALVAVSQILYHFG